MTEDQARALVESLTPDELVLLNEMLKDLERKRQPSQAPRE